MRRIVLWFMSTLTVVTLLFGYHTSTSGATASQTVAAAPATPGSTGSSGSASPTTGTTGSGTTGSGTTGSGTTGSGTTGSGTTGSGTRTVTGSVAQTRWGPVQVAITVANGKITAVDVPQYPAGNGKDQQINAYALPVLKQETLSAQSAGIDMVSGATVTSDGYVRSLQSALDQAGL
jgi:major membrane immunogen (membrane-anchored lipoprotein)